VAPVKKGGKPMLRPQEALAAILALSRPLKALSLPLEQAWGRILAAPVGAPGDYPLFDNAALDGYAVIAADGAGAKPSRPRGLSLRGEQFAGRAWKGRLKRGEALHVTTGSPFPAGADALVPYEAAHREGRRVFIHSAPLLGQNVRRRGEDGRKGSLLAAKGDELHARRVAMLASFGVATVQALSSPRVAVAVSGDELLKPGEAPRPGKIFDGNGPALRALLLEAGLGVPAVARLPDAAGPQARRLGRLLEACDVLIVAGGMSVGERDLAKSVLESLGVKRVFWKVAQKPGKPLYFGVRGRQLVFDLPGNPAALVACFKAYVEPSLRALAGRPRAAALSCALAHGVKACGDKALFLKARIEGQGAQARVRILQGQGSHLLRSLADGNALVLRKAGAKALAKGERVDVLPL
jgi:molybdopterin molybdotransferase